MVTDRDYWQNSAGAWIARVTEGDANRTHLLDPVMTALCAVGVGQTVLDLGCGEGRFARHLSAQGAHVVGLDPTEGLLQEAARQSGPAYVRGVGEALPFRDGTFDWVVSYLSLCDIPDYRASISDIVRVMKPGGQFVACNVNTIVGPACAWIKDDSGEKRHWPLDNYAFESGSVVSWCGITIVNYHRPLSAYMSSLLGNGLRLETFLEPVPTPEALAERPQLRDGLRVPNFWIMVWSKV